MTSVEEFLQFLIQSEEARKLMDEVFVSNKCVSEECKKCVENRFRYWYLKWVFGAAKNPLEIARDLYECLAEG